MKPFSQLVDPKKNNTIVALIPIANGFVLATASEVYTIENQVIAVAKFQDKIDG